MALDIAGRRTFVVRYYGGPLRRDDLGVQDEPVDSDGNTRWLSGATTQRVGRPRATRATVMGTHDESLDTLVHRSKTAGESTMGSGTVPARSLPSDAEPFMKKAVVRKGVPRAHAFKRTRSSSVLDNARRVALRRDVALQVRALVDASMMEFAATLAQRAHVELAKALEVRQAALTVMRQADDPPLLAAAEFARRMDVSDQTVRNLEREDRLFSVLPEGRERGRQYPTFQLYEGVKGEPLAAVLAVLRGQTGATRYQFFTTPSDLLDGYAPVIVLLGVPAEVGEGAQAGVIHLPIEERRKLVLAAARTYRNVIAA